MPDGSADPPGARIEDIEDGPLEPVSIKPLGVGDVGYNLAEFASCRRCGGRVVELAKDRLGSLFSSPQASPGIADPGQHRPAGLAERYVLVAPVHPDTDG